MRSNILTSKCRSAPLYCLRIYVACRLHVSVQIPGRSLQIFAAHTVSLISANLVSIPAENGFSLFDI